MFTVIEYSKVTLINGTIYSNNKGNTIQRVGDTLAIKTSGFSRIVHCPWMQVAEADFLEARECDGTVLEWLGGR